MQAAGEGLADVRSQVSRCRGTAAAAAARSATARPARTADNAVDTGAREGRGHHRGGRGRRRLSQSRRRATPRRPARDGLLTLAGRLLRPGARRPGYTPRMAEIGTMRVKTGLAEMLKGGVIMDVVDAEQARIAEDAGAVRGHGARARSGRHPP